MLQTLRLGPVIVDRSRYLPPIVRPLVQAAERGDDIVAPLLAIVRRFGFDDFTYATANYHLRPDSPAKNAGVGVNALTHDFDQALRPQGSANDIGACETAS